MMSDSKLSMNKAATMWGVSRNTLYKAFSNGTLSRDSGGKIDASEMIRVFGSPNKKSGTEQQFQEQVVNQPVRTTKKAVQTDQIEHLLMFVAQLEQQLADAKEREQWLRQQIKDLQPKRIEHQSERKGILSRIFG